jgi:predicted dehydrogenase
MHLGVLRGMEGVEVVAVADRVASNLSGGGSGGNLAVSGDLSLEGVRTYTDAEDLLADDGVDAVLLSLPTYLHKEMVLRAMERKKHILCEKPMTLTAAEGESLVAALQGYDKAFMVGHCIRFWPAYAKAHALAHSGAYGAIQSAHFVRNSPKPTWSWEAWLLDASKSGGAALDLHIHDVDFALHLLGEPESVDAAGVRAQAEGIAQINAVYRYANGVYAVLDGGWSYPAKFPFRMGFRIQLEGGTLEYNSATDNALHLYTADGEDVVPQMAPGDGYINEWAYFLDCVREGRKPSLVTASSSLDAIRLVERELVAVVG